MIFLIFSILTSAAANANLETTFEGYYRIENQGKHVGFSAVRDQVDSNSKTRTIQYFVFTQDRDHKTHLISSVTKQNSQFVPIEADYSETVNGLKTTSHMTFKKDGTFHWITKTGKNKLEQDGKFIKDEFLRPAFTDVVAQNHLEQGKKYKYFALGDDRALHKGGQVDVVNAATAGGHKIFQIVNHYEILPQESWLADNGQVLLSRIPHTGVTSVLVKNADSAIGSLDVNRTDMTAIFGEIPAGLKNLVSEGKIKVDEKMFSSNIDTKPIDAPQGLPLRLPAALKGK